jgi:hypothetical protein
MPGAAQQPLALSHLYGQQQQQQPPQPHATALYFLSGRPAPGAEGAGAGRQRCVECNLRGRQRRLRSD